MIAVSLERFVSNVAKETRASRPVKKARVIGRVFLRTCVQKVAGLLKLIWTGIFAASMGGHDLVLRVESLRRKACRQVSIQNPKDSRVEILTTALPIQAADLEALHPA